MTYAATIFFLGRYRPAAFIGDHLHDVLCEVVDATEGCDAETRADIARWVIAAEEAMNPRRRNPAAAFSGEYGARGLSVRADPEYPGEAARIGASLPPCPGLAYPQPLTLEA